MHLWLCFWSWYFENLIGGGEMNKVHGKTIFTQNGLSIQKLWQETCFFAKNGLLLSLLGIREKSFSFPIHAVNFCETFSTCSPSSLGQDLMVKNAKQLFFFVWASWVRNGSFEVFFWEKGLCLLEVKPWICVFLIFNLF
jgi:hypothetical protein